MLICKILCNNNDITNMAVFMIILMFNFFLHFFTLFDVYETYSITCVWESP